MRHARQGYLRGCPNGEWKGNNWFTCEDARDPQVDLLLDFACPKCNGKGDCACTGDH